MSGKGFPASERLAHAYQDIFRCHRNRPAFDAKAVEVFLGLIRTADMARAVVERRMRPYGLTGPAFGITMLLSAYPGGLPMVEISRRILVTRANVTGLVDTMEKRGLIERRAHGRDRRVSLVRITAKARNILDRILPGHFKFIGSLVGKMSLKERSTVVKALEKIRVALLSCRERK